MPSRKKPIGIEWVRFAKAWQEADHKGKIKLANDAGVTYDSAKHWISEGDTDIAVPAPHIDSQIEEQEKVVDEILSIKSKVHLDFVTFDIESSNLTADFAILLTACIKPYNCNPISFRADAYPAWESNRADDSAICRDVAQELSKHAIVVTHYGTKFDLPFIKAKMLEAEMPMLPPMFHIDTYAIAKGNFKLSRRRLETLAEYLSLGKKEGVSGALWMKAAYGGDTEALDKIMAHNVQDCYLLEKLACMCFSYLKSIPKV